MLSGLGISRNAIVINATTTPDGGKNLFELAKEYIQDTDQAIVQDGYNQLKKLGEGRIPCVPATQAEASYLRAKVARQLYPDNLITNFEHMRRAAVDFNYPEAQVELGLLYANGCGVDQNNKAAFDCFELASRAMVSSALYELHICYSNERGVEANPELAKGYLIEAATVANPSPIALSKCGKMLHEDDQKVVAKEMLGKAIEAGYTDDCYEMAILCSEEFQDHFNYEETYYYLDIAANAGHPAALFQMGMGYIRYGCQREWTIELASCSENNLAQSVYHHLLKIQLNETNAQKDEQTCEQKRFLEGIDYLVKASKAGHAEASYLLGTLFAAGFKVNEDSAQAGIYFKQAYEQGKAESSTHADKKIAAKAAFRFAQLIENRSIASSFISFITSDPDTTEKWYTNAADLGYLAACAKIGRVYSTTTTTTTVTVTTTVPNIK